MEKARNLLKCDEGSKKEWLKGYNLSRTRQSLVYWSIKFLICKLKSSKGEKKFNLRNENRVLENSETWL